MSVIQTAPITVQLLDESTGAAASNHMNISGLIENAENISGEKAHPCRLCEEEFDTYLELLRHATAAHSCELPESALSLAIETTTQNAEMSAVTELYECTECGLQFKKIVELNEHIAMHFAAKTIKVGGMPATRAEQEHGKMDSVAENTLEDVDYLPHKGTPGRTHFCRICDRSFTRSFSLKNHMLIHSGEKPHQCHYCDKSFREATKLKNHMAIHSDAKPHICPVCAKAFSVQAYLRTHMMIHTGKKPYKCKMCELSFGSSGNLKRHTRVHTGEKPFHCDFCGSSFAQMGNLEAHKRTHTGIRPYECEICGKGFMQSSGLVEHIRTHSGVKPYNCDVCGRAFAGSSGLRVHKRTHTGEKPHECHICLKRFSASGNLKTHMKIHLGLKPFTCDYCGKGFVASGNLSQHVRMHTGEKPYICKLCGKTFSGNGGLKIHMMGHYDEKPYSCEHCDKGFKTKQKLLAHTRVHTGERPFTCSRCDKTFILSEKLKHHLRKKHNIGVKPTQRILKAEPDNEDESSREPPSLSPRPMSPEVSPSTTLTVLKKMDRIPRLKTSHEIPAKNADPYHFDDDESPNAVEHREIHLKMGVASSAPQEEPMNFPPNLGSPMVTDPTTGALLNVTVCATSVSLLTIDDQVEVELMNSG